MAFENIATELGIEIARHGEHHHARSGWVNLDCPRCSPDSKRYRLGFNTRFAYMNCWSCGKMPVVAALMEASGRSSGEIVKLLEQLQRPKIRDDLPTPSGKLIMPKNCGTLERAHVLYLERRGFPDIEELQRIWRIKGTGAISNVPWRIVMPIEYRGKPVSWIARTIGEASPRYLAAAPEEESMPRKQLLYGYDYVRHACIIVEGPTDAWAIGPGAVSICGLGISRAQIKMLVRIPSRIICFDNEPAAQRRASKLADMLAAFPGDTTIAQIETGKDAASASKKEVRQLRRLLG